MKFKKFNCVIFIDSVLEYSYYAKIYFFIFEIFLQYKNTKLFKHYNVSSVAYLQ